MTLLARQEIPYIVIHSVMRARAKSYLGGIGVPLRKGCPSKRASGIPMGD